MRKRWPLPDRLLTAVGAIVIVLSASTVFAHESGDVGGGFVSGLTHPLFGWDHVVALAGNPNTGKSTVFNALTGLRQHTGNWPGKTVARAQLPVCWRRPVRALKSVLLPVLGLPARAMVKSCSPSGGTSER